MQIERAQAPDNTLTLGVTLCYASMHIWSEDAYLLRIRSSSNTLVYGIHAPGTRVNRPRRGGDSEFDTTHMHDHVFTDVRMRRTAALLLDTHRCNTQLLLKTHATHARSLGGFASLHAGSNAASPM